MVKWIEAFRKGQLSIQVSCPEELDTIVEKTKVTLYGLSTDYGYPTPIHCIGRQEITFGYLRDNNYDFNEVIE